MSSENFINWLLTNKNMSIRSAKDVLSRCGRVCRMLHIDEISEKSLQELIICEEFNEKTMFIKSQLKRSVTLYIEYKNQSKAVMECNQK